MAWAANTTVRQASMASCWWWDTGRARRSPLVMRNDCSTLQKVVAGRDNRGAVHPRGGQVGDVALAIPNSG